MLHRGVLGTGFWNGASTLKQYLVLPKNGSKYYLKYTFLAFPVLGILGLSTPLVLYICIIYEGVSIVAFHSFSLVCRLWLSVLGGHFVGGVGDISFGPFGCG